jgi:hypothetical protein
MREHKLYISGVFVSAAVVLASDRKSVAVLVDGEPMAFIAEGKLHRYSEALRKPGLGNTWDEALFHSTFKA